MAEEEHAKEFVVSHPSELRRSARLRKLKENKGTVLSPYFSEPVQSSAAQIRRVSKSKGKRRRDQSRYVYKAALILLILKL